METKTNRIQHWLLWIQTGVQHLLLRRQRHACIHHVLLPLGQKQMGKQHLLPWRRRSDFTAFVTFRTETGKFSSLASVETVGWIYSIYGDTVFACCRLNAPGVHRVIFTNRSPAEQNPGSNLTKTGRNRSWC